ncbi:MAG: AbrB/MazE/SpoVT family DNA-binding domain-containing protein [Actinobacteria bacterium]|nr:AbrB/MazE/SpoVT family DNA-binding domain-containing protein [Actinomycetota bacterium]
MLNKIKVTSKGQITIPKSIREKLKIKVGSYLTGFVKEDSIILKLFPESIDKTKLLDFVYSESLNSIGVNEVREVAKGFNLNMARQVRKVREEDINGYLKAEKDNLSFVCSNKKLAKLAEVFGLRVLII